MNLPKDPVMLLSVVNTALRDHYDSLDAMADDKHLDKEDIMRRLGAIDYHYDEACNQFK